MVRIATAAVLAPALWLAIRQAPPLVFCVAALAVSAIACWECYGILEAGGHRPFKWLGLSAGIGVVWSFVALPPVFAAELPLVVLSFLTLGLAVCRRAEPREMLASSAYTLFPVLFVALGLGYLVGLRRAPGEDGQDLLLLLFCCVILSDTAAYYVGRSLGRHKMAPRLSPKKTFEGAAGGLLASAAGGLLAHLWFYQRLPVGHALGLGLIIGGAAIFGDLAESVVKRAGGVKDSSALLPGHGGLLDRTDSLLFAGPVLYYYYELFLRGSA